MSAVSLYRQYVDNLKAALDAIPMQDLEAATTMIESAWRAGRTIFVCGNGGSAATASHFACDLSKTTLGKLSPLPARRIRCVALTDSMPLMTAWGNDSSYDLVFSEQLRNLAREGDLLIAISASGNSPNIFQALEAARELGVATVGFLGFGGGRAAQMVDRAIVIASDDYGVVEDAHSVLMHMLTARMKEILAEG